jgi:hypothetical protein
MFSGTQGRVGSQLLGRVGLDSQSAMGLSQIGVTMTLAGIKSGASPYLTNSVAQAAGEAWVDYWTNW